MTANPRKVPSALMLGAASLLLVGPLACQRSAEADGAISRDPPSAESAPAVARADTPPARPAGPAAGGDSAAAGTDGAADAAGDQKAAPESAAAGADPVGQVSGNVVNGWKQYEVICSRCHGQDALGSAFAPDLRESVKGRLDRDAFMQVAKNGRVEKGMPGFAVLLEDQQIADIYAYLMARSSGKLGPGRPKS
jgi:mono/diheme cytochrome c family protein